MADRLTQIQNDYKEALKAGNKLGVAVLRFLLSALQNKEIEKRAKGEKMTQDDILGTVQKQIQIRKESIEAYKKGKREDLVRREQQELAILQKYLPKQLLREELENIVHQVIKETKAEGLKDLGKVMGRVIKKVKGRTEGKVVSEMVKSCLIAKFQITNPKSQTNSKF